ncbi:hypothetical protein JCM15519_16840 [Fundidesulfovibrio butyratiphilus]
MAFTAGRIINMVARQLHDVAHTRWTQDEKLLFLNLAQLQVVTYQPQANAKFKTIPLVAGARQVLSAQDLKLMTIMRNMGADGNTPGRYVAVTDRATLDSSLAQWTTPQAAVSEIESYVVDSRVDAQFFVYPPPSDPGLQVECVVSERPDDCADEDSDIVIPDIYVSPLMHWMFYLCLAFQMDSPASSQQALSHYQLFYSELGIELKASDLVTPNYREQYLIPQQAM